MGILSWLFGTKTKAISESDDKNIDPQEIIAKANREALQMFQDFEKANNDGNSAEVMQNYKTKHQIIQEDLDDRQDETDDAILEYSEKTRNQQILELTSKQREAMLNKKNDVDHQLKICKQAMDEGSILPFPFERAAILLTKEKRYSEALEVCEYTAWWCGAAKDGYDGWSSANFDSPVLKKIVDRIPKLKAKQ